MPLNYTQFKIDYSHVPGPGAQTDVFYCGHPSAMCRVYVWRPDGWDTTGFQNAPVLVVLHHGFGHNPGDRACEPSSIGGIFPELAETLHARGWVIVSLDYPPCPSNDDEKNEQIGMEFWLNQYLTVCRGIAWLRSLAKPLETDLTKVALEANTMHKTLWGVDASGRVNTCDPNLIGAAGRSHGGCLAMFAGWFPDALVRHYGALSALSTDVYSVRASHKPNFVISAIGQALWTKFHVDTGTDNILGPIYQNGVHQQFMRKTSQDKWSEVPMWQKAAASPYIHLIAGHPENRGVPVWASWGATNLGSTSAPVLVATNLTAADNDPFKVEDDVAGKKCWWDPHDPFPQAPMVKAAIAQYGDPRSRIIFGNNSNNPGGPNNATVTDEAQDCTDWILATFGK